MIQIKREKICFTFFDLVNRLMSIELLLFTCLWKLNCYRAEPSHQNVIQLINTSKWYWSNAKVQINIMPLGSLLLHTSFSKYFGLCIYFIHSTFSVLVGTVSSDFGVTWPFQLWSKENTTKNYILLNAPHKILFNVFLIINMEKKLTLKQRAKWFVCMTLNDAELKAP